MSLIEGPQWHPPLLDPSPMSQPADQEREALKPGTLSPCNLGGTWAPKRRSPKARMPEWRHAGTLLPQKCSSLNSKAGTLSHQNPPKNRRLVLSSRQRPPARSERNSVASTGGRQAPRKRKRVLRGFGGVQGLAFLVLG